LSFILLNCSTFEYNNYSERTLFIPYFSYKTTLIAKEYHLNQTLLAYLLGLNEK